MPRPLRMVALAGLLAGLPWFVAGTRTQTVAPGAADVHLQLATLLFSADAQAGKWTVFAAASAALVCAAGIGVLVGGQLGQWVTPRTLHLVAGIGFIGIGVWTLVAR